MNAHGINRAGEVGNFVASRAGVKHLEIALGDPIINLVPASSDSPVRWGTIRSHGDNQELWWYGPQAVLWQRGNRTLSGAQALVAGDRLTLGTTVIEWDVGQKPGLT